jgi:hypothetical protein
MNGNIVDVPYIYNEQWSVLGIGFSNLLDFSSYTGRIYMTGPIMFNNLSYYLANDLQQKQKIQSRSWSDVTASSATWTTWKTPLDLNSDGDYVDPYEHDGTWKGIYVVKESFEYNVSPDIVYGHYVGTDRIIFDDPINGIMVNPQQATVYTVPSWSITTKTPV